MPSQLMPALVSEVFWLGQGIQRPAPAQVARQRKRQWDFCPHVIAYNLIRQSNILKPFIGATREAACCPMVCPVRDNCG